MRDYMISGYVISNVGLKRCINEDNYLINQSMNELSKQISEGSFSEKQNQPWKWAGVFDGMGGGDRGEQASRIAAEELRKSMEKATLRTTEKIAEKLVREGFLNANKRIVEERKNHAILGTTATFLVIHDNRIKISHLGDSRAYLLREGRFSQITRDQTLENLKIEAGFYDSSHPDAKKDRQKLTEYIGADETMVSLLPLESEWITLKQADKILLCSDGLYHFCSDEEIKAVLQSADDTTILTDKLIRRALKNGGTDNVTCLVINVGKQEIPSGRDRNGNRE